MDIQQVFGLATIALLCVSGSAAALSMVVKSRQSACLAAVITLVVIVVPFSSLMFVEILRGLTGDLSITTVFLLGLGLVCRCSGKRWFAAQEVFNLQVVLIVTGLLFYPAALGLFMVDTYSSGYEVTSIWTAWFLAGFAILLKQHLMALVLLTALLAHGAGVFESDNLWDYLIDPLVFLYAVMTSLFYVVTSRRQTKLAKI